MDAYQPYIDQLESLLSNSKDKSDDVCNALNGEPYMELRKLVGRDELRENGIFFTDFSLADSLIGTDSNFIKNQKITLDPACGTGNLLLEVAKHLPIEKTLNKTLRQWGKALAGFDLFEEFIVVAKIRIALLAIQRGAKGKIDSIEQLDSLLPMLKKHDALIDDELYKKSTMIVMNPPFQLVSCPEGTDWKKGKVSLSAVILEHCISRVTKGTTIKAILPEVLRTGSSYVKWRRIIERRTIELRYESKGLFSPWGDVDVFTLNLIKNEHDNHYDQNGWQEKIQIVNKTLSDIHEIKVGTVVPHRHKEEGRLHAYIHARNVTPWQVISRITEQRQFSGRVFTPPFVVVRRTSRPGDKYRATASIITGKRKVAVENHLLILTPKDHKYNTCLRTMDMLKSKAVNDHLNTNMRCRHLTVSSLKMMPWVE